MKYRCWLVSGKRFTFFFGRLAWARSPSAPVLEQRLWRHARRATFQEMPSLLFDISTAQKELHILRFAEHFLNMIGPSRN